MSQIVDLTLTLHHGMRGVEFEQKFTVAQDGWNARTLHLYSHGGTHMDAPLHFGVVDPTSLQTIDQTPLESCIGPAWIVDLSGIAPRDLITVASLGKLVEQVQAHDSLLIKTGWSAHINDAKIYRDALPRIAEDLARWCVARRIKMLGVEPPSVADVNNLSEVTLIHQILLRGGVTIVEGLTNLEALRSPCVVFYALPLKIGGGDGSPCRAFAMDE